jgi:hypothetical protein
MRVILTLAMIAFWSAVPPAFAVVSVDLPNECSDRNALQGVAYDARLTAIKFYYKGVISQLSDKPRQACLEAQVLMDDHLAVINRTRAIVESQCLPIDVAASLATKDLCR